MRSRQLQGTITATSTGTIFFDIPDNTTIRGVSFSVTPSIFGALADYIECEVTCSSSAQQATSDAQDIIAIASFTQSGNGTAASATAVSLNVYSPAGRVCKPGDRVYLNVLENGSSTWRVRALVWFE